MNTNWNSIQWRTLRVQDFYKLGANWGWIFAEGVALIILGIIAMTTSVFATIASMAFLGWLLLFGGVVHSIHAFSTVKEHSFAVTLLTGIAYAVAGILIIGSPLVTALMLTYLIAPLFIVGGIVRAVYATIKQFPQWGWSALSGIMGVVLGVLIWNQLPSAALWVIGMLVGIEMFFSGLAILTLAMALKALPKASLTEKLAA